MEISVPDELIHLRTRAEERERERDVQPVVMYGQQKYIQ